MLDRNGTDEALSSDIIIGGELNLCVVVGVENAKAVVAVTADESSMAIAPPIAALLRIRELRLMLCLFQCIMRWNAQNLAAWVNPTIE